MFLRVIRAAPVRKRSAAYNQCHLAQNLTDTRFHNLGVGWDAKAKKFADLRRHAVS